jgi:magnesium-protoporphyrin O-methyltransferase
MSTTYNQRRGEIETYFDRTAAAAWSRLTSDAPVSGIRATVRAGRDRMRATLMSRLPEDLRGARILDAGCGTGALAVEAAKRGAEVVAVDLSPTLVDLARQRMPTSLDSGCITFIAGDMLDPSLGKFDHVVAMDSLIHYALADMTDMLAKLAARSGASVCFTFAPRSAALAVMHAVGKVFPRGDRSPAIVPHREKQLLKSIAAEPRLAGWVPAFSERIDSGFYISQAMELRRP